MKVLLILLRSIAITRVFVPVTMLTKESLYWRAPGLFLKVVYVYNSTMQCDMLSYWIRQAQTYARTLATQILHLLFVAIPFIIFALLFPS